MIQKYPIGIQDFEKLRTQNFLYVDKTEYVYRMADISSYYFLSRPRRFGKSLFLSTLEYLFQGKRELFKGLYIENKWNWGQKNPVIKISFASISHKDKGLRTAINDQLDKTAYDFDLQLKETSISAKFQELIETIARIHGKVVVLIDEYDKPIIDYLGTDTEKAIENRDIMKIFYSILKDADPHLRLVFITGISKFSKVSIFSDLNNLQDITTSKYFAGICGITQEELESNFREELKELDKKEIQQWYNGYTWDLEMSGQRTAVYNPFSLLNFFVQGGVFKSFWFESGTPTFLINLSKNLKAYDFENRETTLTTLSSYDIERLQLIPLMFQTGYLTLKSYDEIGEIYTLDFPNKEVRKSYLEVLLDAYTEYQEDKRGIVLVNEIRKSLSIGNLEHLQSILNSLFKSIPYTLWQKENEHFYHAIIHLTFKLLGIYVDSEVQTSDGRMDVLVRLPNYVYCFEFKLDETADEALQQIRNKGYLTPYLHEGKTCIGIGVNFSKEDKKVKELKWEKYT